MSRFRIYTESGSVYMVEQRADGWWYGAANVPNYFSRQVGEGVWPIREPDPWPPEIGKSIVLMTAHLEDLHHPMRVPGGGKVTSRVTRVEEVSPE